MESGDGWNNGSSQQSSENYWYAFNTNQETPVLNSLNDLSTNTASYPSIHLLTRNELSMQQEVFLNFDGSSADESSIERQTPQLSHHLSSIGSCLNQMSCLTSNRSSRHQSNVSQPPALQASRGQPIYNEYLNPQSSHIPTSERHIFSSYDCNVSHPTALQASGSHPSFNEYSNPPPVQKSNSQDHLFPRFESNVTHPTTLQASGSHPSFNEYSNPTTGHLSGIEMGMIQDTSSPWSNENFYNVTQYQPPLTKCLGENANTDLQSQNLNTHQLFQQCSSSSPLVNSSNKSLFQNRQNKIDMSWRKLLQTEKTAMQCFNAPSQIQFVNVIVVGADSRTPIELIRTFVKDPSITPGRSFSMAFYEHFFKKDETWRIGVWYIYCLNFKNEMLRNACESSNTAIVLSYEGTDQDCLSEVQYWIKILKRDVPIVLVFNNKDCEMLASKLHSNNIDIMNRHSNSDGLRLMVKFELAEFFECYVESVHHVDVIFESAINLASVSKL